MSKLRNLSRRTVVFLIALPAVAITLISFNALLSAVSTAAASDQSSALLQALSRPALQIRRAMTVDPAARGEIELLLGRINQRQPEGGRQAQESAPVAPDDDPMAVAPGLGAATTPRTEPAAAAGPAAASPSVAGAAMAVPADPGAGASSSDHAGDRPLQLRRDDVLGVDG